MLEKLFTSKQLRVSVSIIMFLFLFATGTYFYSALGLAVSFYILLDLISNLGDSLPVIEYMSFLAAFQLIISAYNSYATGFTHQRYGMAVPEETYMSITVPMFIAFVIPAYKYRKKLYLNKEKLQDFISFNPKLPFALIGMGVISIFIKNLVPPGIAFFVFLLSHLLYIGAIAILYSSNKYKWFIFGIIVIFPLFHSISSGMFHDTIMLYTFMGMFIINVIDISKTKTFFLLLLFLISLNTLQTFKQGYREMIWKGYSGDKVELFFDLWVETLFGKNPEVSEDNYEEAINIRFNQGWIVSKIYAYIPDKGQSLGGKTIKEAIIASLVPRFISPYKKTGRDSKKDFEMMTGIKLGESTAMGTSIFGEAYGNYELIGGMVFMAIWGFLMGYLTIFYQKQIDKSVYLIFFIPILYLMSIRAESTFLATLNWFVKASIFIFIVNYGLKRAGIISNNYKEQ